MTSWSLVTPGHSSLSGRDYLLLQPVYRAIAGAMCEAFHIGISQINPSGPLAFLDPITRRHEVKMRGCRAHHRAYIALHFQ